MIPLGEAETRLYIAAVRELRRRVTRLYDFVTAYIDTAKRLETHPVESEKTEGRAKLLATDPGLQAYWVAHKTTAGGDEVPLEVAAGARGAALKRYVDGRLEEVNKVDWDKTFPVELEELQAFGADLYGAESEAADYGYKTEARWEPPTMAELSVGIQAAESVVAAATEGKKTARTLWEQIPTEVKVGAGALAIGGIALKIFEAYGRVKQASATAEALRAARGK